MGVLPLLTPTEQHELGHRLPYGEVRALPGGDPASRFAVWAERDPARVAFRQDDVDLSYGELDRRAGALAAKLRHLGVAPEEPIGVCLPRGLSLPVAALAAWRAGGAYLPLDPDNPPERLAYMVRDSGARVVIADPTTADRLPAGITAVLVTGAGEIAEGGEVAGGGAVVGGGDLATSASDPPPPHPDQVACVIYTSGSTGAPKGVALTNRSLLNRIDWLAAACPFQPGEVGCLKTPIAFVDSLWDILGPLLHGIPSVVVPGDAALDPETLVRRLADGGVTRLLLVPSLLRMLLTAVPDLADRLPELRVWISSGEALPGELVKRFADQLPGRALHNLYGASEAWDSLFAADVSADVSAGPEPAVTVPVGRPVANVTAYVLDGLGQLVPIGVPGELYVGGACLARGYLSRPDLTATRFVPDPYGGSGGRLYRTGDRARHRPDGQIELLGRLDDQVKIRGIRVEPAEVEAALSELDGVRQAAVVARRAGNGDGSGGSGDGDGDGDLLLAAYVVASGAADPRHLRSALAQRVPPHLVPATVTVLPELPLTATGKVDRRALPAPTIVPVGADQPASDTERTVAEVWAEVLGVERVGLHDDFFDIGGHSLLATELAARLGARMGHPVPVRAVFEYPTVHAMASGWDEIATAARAGTDR